jgi:RNA-splicing ligase RtcB
VTALKLDYQKELTPVLYGNSAVKVIEHPFIPSAHYGFSMHWHDRMEILVIHSGSRNLGTQVAEYYQSLAVDLNLGKDEYFQQRDALIADYKAQGRRGEIQAALKELAAAFKAKEATIPEDLCYLYGRYMDDYLHDVVLCQEFAKRSREKMAEIILQRCGLTAVSAFHTIHNYIDADEMILRKGAIAAHAGELVLIPINMRDGSILARGKGDSAWNFSAPHGAGRLMSRSKAREALSLEDFQKSMEGVYTTSVNASTIDEAPMAYKSLADIIDVIADTVDIIEVLRPIYNYKASS